MDPYHAGGLLLDVRTTAEWKAGHFQNAVHVPVDELPARLPEIHDRAFALQRMGPIPEDCAYLHLDVPILVMCKLGRRAERAKRILERGGFNRVCNIGGIDVEPLASMIDVGSRAWVRGLE